MKRSLKSAILIPFIVVFFITFIGITSVQFYKFENRIESLGKRKTLAITNSIKLKLDNFLKEPLHLGMAISNLISLEHLNSYKDLSHIQSYLHATTSDMYHNLPQVDVVGYGNSNSEYVGFRKGKHHSHLLLKDERTQGLMTFFAGDSIGSDTVMTVNNYDPQTRPWYISAIEASSPVWSTIYNSIDIYDKANSTVSAVIPVGDDLTDPTGVLALDISLSELTSFMVKLKSDYEATVYIFDDNGEIISHSGSDNIDNFSFTQHSTRLSTVIDPVVIESLKKVASLDDDSLINPTSYQTTIGGETFFNSVHPYITVNNDNFHWYIGVSVSKSSLFEDSVQHRILSWIIGLSVCAIGLFIVALYIDKIIFPIQLTIAATNKLANGHKIGKIDNNGNIKEINMLISSFNRMSTKVEKSINKLKSQVFNDELTGLLSKAGFVDGYKKLEIQEGTLFLFRINGFKELIDSLGHEKSDLVLQAVAERLSKFTDQECLIAAIEPGEFAMFSPRHFDSRQSKVYAKSIKQFLTERLNIQGVDVAFRIAVGIVLAFGPDQGMDKGLRNASVALSGEKHSSGHIFYFNDKMLEAIESKTQMYADIKKGIENQEFTPFYQPIVDLKTGNVVGAEALARWVSTESGLIPPDKFIPVAEESGFIDLLGESILYQACIDTNRGIKEGKWMADFKMHVNISVMQLSRASFLTTLQEIMNSTNISPKNLSLEITESGLAENQGIFNRNLEAILAMGIHVSIDDFGTGYSSLSYLQELEFDCLKIDRAFVSTLTEANSKSSLTAMILNISQSIDTYVVAEGIETEMQAKVLNELGCQLGQGYYFGRPVPYESW